MNFQFMKSFSFLLELHTLPKILFSVAYSDIESHKKNDFSLKECLLNFGNLKSGRKWIKYHKMHKNY